jgi:hypothetical protein
MNIRLKIAAPDSAPAVFEHAGPVVRIGRDPACELVLDEKTSAGASRQHASIELSAAGATLTDLGSSNGTLLNGRPLQGPAALHVGDRIQLGYTGATLTVQALDLAPPSVFAGSATKWIAAAVAAGLVLAVTVGAIALSRGAKKPVPVELFADSGRDAGLVSPPTTGSGDLRSAVSAGSGDPRRAQTGDPRRAQTGDPRRAPDLGPKSSPPPEPKPIRPVEKPDPALPSLAVKPVGKYVALDRWLCVLLQRQGEANPWAVVRPESEVSTAQTLVSLPGYRSLIALNSGLRLTLWGDLPEFSAFPPVLECVTMLNVPAAGTDLDLTLDRGRVVIANRKAGDAAARVCLRFLRQVWELELPGKGEAALELWTMPRSARPVACVGLFVKGPVRVRTPRQTYDVTERAPLRWTSQEPTTYYHSPLKDPPAWWTPAPDRKKPGVDKALSSLVDWSQLLNGPTKNAADSVVTKIKTQVEETKDADNQDVGLFFLAALDEIEPLIGFLNDRQNANVRGDTRYALQTWLSRDEQHADELRRILVGRGDGSPALAERIVQRLQFLPQDALDRRETYAGLISDLDDESLMIRDLAYWHLDRLGVGGRLPEEAKAIKYDPTGPREERRAAVQQWKKLLDGGKIPVRR